jgi:Family of unknown function (DUF6298)
VAFGGTALGRTGLACLGVAAACALLPAAAASPAAPKPPDRTLRVLKSNPRYFTDGSGRAVYLTGSHPWWNLAADAPWAECRARGTLRFTYPWYLRFLKRHGHNFIRLWRLELTRWRDCRGGFATVPLHPWPRTGPGRALDGLPRFDLTRFDPRYFARLRARVAAARRARIYVAVMLFEGWQVQFQAKEWRWASHPFNPANNVNGVNGDVNGDGVGLEVHTLANRRVTAIQEAYVRKVIDTVNTFDNVLYEIANESHVGATAWHYRMIDLVKRYERRKPKRHPVGMGYQHGDHADRALHASRADWISPYAGGPDALANPFPTNGRKVVILDTDHLCGMCGDALFVWKSFVRGHNPIFMDPLDAEPGRTAARIAMGRTRRYSRRIDLRYAIPRIDLASTWFALARPGREYLVLQPASGRFWVDLGPSPRARRWAGEWLEPASGRVVRFRSRRAAGRSWFDPPWNGPAVLLLRALDPASR